MCPGIVTLNRGVKWGKVTGPSFSEARAFQRRRFISSEPETMNLASPLHATVITRCMRFVWYTSLQRRPSSPVRRPSSGKRRDGEPAAALVEGEDAD